MAYSATLLNTNLLANPISQAAHGFTLGEILRFNGTIFVTAQADSETNSEVVGMVSSIGDANTFWITQVGYVPALTTGPYVAGTLYYLSPTNPGELTATKPTAAGQVELPCFIAYTTTSGYFFSGVGDLITSGPLFAWTVVTINTNMSVNQGYIVNGGGSINLLLPATSVIGDIIEIATLGTNGCVVTQGAGQSLNIVDVTSTVGAGGTTTLQTTGGVLSGSIRLLCVATDTQWKSIAGTGTWNPA